MHNETVYKKRTLTQTALMPSQACWGVFSQNRGTTAESTNGVAAYEGAHLAICWQHPWLCLQPPLQPQRHLSCTEYCYWQ